jgi:hypothetical protein
MIPNKLSKFPKIEQVSLTLARLSGGSQLPDWGVYPIPSWFPNKVPKILQLLQHQDSLTLDKIPTLNIKAGFT